MSLHFLLPCCPPWLKVTGWAGSISYKTDRAQDLGKKGHLASSPCKDATQLQILRDRLTSIPEREVLPSQGVAEKPPDTLPCGLALFLCLQAAASCTSVKCLSPLQACPAQAFVCPPSATGMGSVKQEWSLWCGRIAVRDRHYVLVTEAGIAPMATSPPLPGITS